MKLSAKRSLFALATMVAVAACFPGARAPQVPPERTLELPSEGGAKTSTGPFRVVFAGPKGDTAVASQVTIVFSRPLRALGVAGEEPPAPATITAREAEAPRGEWHWLGTSALVFAPREPLARATEYEVRVPGTTRALDGSTLGQDYAFSFRTALPRLVSMSPPEGSSRLTPSQAFALRFNQPVDPEEVARATSLVLPDGKKIPTRASRPKPDVTTLVTLTPARPLPLDSSVSVVVDATLRGLEGPLASGEERRMRVHTYGPLALRESHCSRQDDRTCLPHGGVSISLSNRVKFKDLRAHVRFEPHVPIRWSKTRSDDALVRWVNLPVDLRPARTYRVVVTPGLRDEYGQTLGKRASATFVVGDEMPRLKIGVEGQILEASKAKGKSVDVSAMNVADYELLSAAPDEGALARLLTEHHDRWGVASGLQGAKVAKVHPKGARNVAQVRRVALDPLLARGHGRGAVVLGTSRQGPRAPISRVEVLSVTDLGVSAKVSRFGSVVFVSRLSSGAPVAGATVTIRDDDGAEISSKRTDASGLASFTEEELPAVEARGQLSDDVVIFARSGEDWTFRRADEAVYRADLPRLDLEAAMHTFGMLFTDRGIYKPGEKVLVKGVFRKPIARGLETPAGRAVTIRATDSQGQTMFEHEAKLGEFGELSTEIAIPKTSRLGMIAIDADVEGEARRPWQGSAAHTSVRVAAYRPAEFKVAVEPDHPSYVRGGKARFTVRGDYLFGAPMSGGQVTYTVTRSPAFFTPPGLDGFVTNDEAYWWALPNAVPRGGAVQSGDGALSAKGSFDVEVPLAMPKQIGPEEVTFEAEIEDLSRQTVASHSTTVVHPAAFYVALQPPKDIFQTAGAKLSVVAAAVAPSGARKAGVPVHVELVRRTWKTVTESTGGSGLHYESRPVDETLDRCELVSNAKTSACALTLSRAGYFIVHARAKDAHGNEVGASYSVYVTGQGEGISWPVYDSAKLDLVADKTSYEVGDTATILIKNPFKEAEALVTVERQGVASKRTLHVRGPMPTVKVPVTADMWPNTYVSVELVKGRTAATRGKKEADPGAPSFRVGYAEIRIDPDARRLRVKVTPKRRELRPGEQVEVDLLVTDRAGKPSRADVAFYAVDEGVLMLTGYQTPDPLGVFGARRSLSVMPIESRDDLAKLVRLGLGPGRDKGDQGGGGGGEGEDARSDFRSTAYFLPSVVTGTDGRAHVSFKLPDSLTTYRLMAVATSQDDRFGFGQDQIVTSRPLMARPALPRFFRAGDAVSAGVIVTSKGLPASEVSVSLRAEGLLVNGPAEQKVKLPANGSVEVVWPIAAEAAGKAALTFTARAGDATDTVIVKREVEVPLSIESVALTGETAKAVAEKLGDLRSIRADVGELAVRMASTALVGLDDGVDALIDYPYGCTEQLTSRMVPLVALTDLAKDYGIDLPADTRGIVDTTLARVLRAQRGDGSFGYWVDSPAPDTFVTAYALWGLSLAKAHQHPVPDDALAKATAWLRARVAACAPAPASGEVRRGRPRPGAVACGSDKVALATQAFVLDVLAMTGQADAGFMNRLFERRAELPLFARAWLAHAMAVSKMRLEDARALVQDVDNHVRVTSSGATVVDNVGDAYAPLLDSEARTTAIVLRTLVTVNPEHPLAARLAKGLLAARRGGEWRTTQENAWALLALDAYRKAQESESPDFDAVAFFGERELFRVPFHGRSVKSESRSVPVAKLLASPGQTLAFTVDGRGKLFYQARLRYAKKELPSASLDRGFFVKKLVRSVSRAGIAEALRTVPQVSATHANASDLVLVDLFVVTPTPREQVVIDDPLPAGLEAVDTSLATTAMSLGVTEPGAEGDRADRRASDADARAMGRAFEQTWYHREMHDDRVLTFVDHMPAGMVHYRYLARATTPGRFVVPPTKAECMYEPETFGRTAGSVFEVKASP